MTLTLAPNSSPRSNKAAAARGWIRLIEAVRSVTGPAAEGSQRSVAAAAAEADWDGEVVLDHGHLVLRAKRA